MEVLQHENFSMRMLDENIIVPRKTSIASLKSIASELVSVPADVSSDDTSTAFIWRAATHVRLPRLDPSIRSTIASAVDFLGEAEENGLEFKLGLGTPQAVRRLQFQTLEGLAFLMRRTLQDGIEAAICLRDEDMGSMRVDAEFAKYAMYIG
ncbi:hypothetical protein PENANT_c036G09956 [Penicillium antarcticum]|uniref:Uncharacterized protein n=1 Tax=Penicillium antarcticum TaxID=416450 RepID=A0A1V6PV59_9EURO|nr:hypothetical protein PENANT_c036G09956 [Penicillium antarcticum]